MKKLNIKEIKEITFKKENDIYHVFITEPLSLPVLYLIQNIKIITPNLISFLGFILTLVATWFFFKGSFIIGALMYFISYFTDSLDGKLARLRKTANPFGGFVDSVFDTFRTPILTLGLIFYLSYSFNHILIFVILVIYPILILSYDYLCATAYNMNKSKQLMTVLEEKQSDSVLLKLKKSLKRYRLRLAYTSAETNALVFLLIPILSSIFGKIELVIYGYILGDILVLSLMIPFLFLQGKELKKQQKT
jgi:phosphatidylglycerophosphate synthase